MPSSIARLRFPFARVLLPRTKLAYVHLRNLLTDAKRDRTGRVFGYVAIWLSDEMLLLYMQEGEVVNATTTRNGVEFRTLPIAEALAHVPPEPEFGEICFHEADDEQLACMHWAQTRRPDPWPSELEARDPRQLFPYLMATTFDGMLQIVVDGSVNYLLFRDGAVVRGYLAEELHGTTLAERAKPLFQHRLGRDALQIARWPVPPAVPIQAPTALIKSYAELVGDVVARLVRAGSDGAPAVAESARLMLLDRHPVLASFAADAKEGRGPAYTSPELTRGVAAWVAEVLWATGGQAQIAPEDLLRELAHGRRHVLQSAGFFDLLPWKVSW
ncbi:MAG TPA: hypothetical protein VKA84_23755 [Gemmatimonadaceae bacterium]|nr:hypothetical protein [Gemmatimonadaceae bacterium]